MNKIKKRMFIGRTGLFLLTEDDIVFVRFEVRFGTFVQSRLKRDSAAF